ncbi:hypothetical protein [Mesorhizobium sp. ZC-5]|uniref:hypothetical protein n=1 Tax=Mesorhizobium sp. ZC-5 TaxID=2986066 RepID=UPI0021E8D4FA|nr:hypothetical protein [Mesorhizobium sp. ZC-5]MCV3241657.1 hypothetical protein [Mesorhizobium sp. ZC-5]
MTRSPDHDILARIVALLLGLASLAERAALRPLAVRLTLLWILLPAHCVALRLLDIPADAADPHPSKQTPAPPEIGDGTGALFHLAISFRATAALLLHAWLNGGVPTPHTPRHATALSRTCPSGPSRRRFLGWVGMVRDTS